jgi:2-polyprenyl-3-methyl-5-hydroxy-6-metoxy-1,4-benzoquinol methylase
MDRPGLLETSHREALVGLRRVNALSQTAAVLWRALAATGLPQAGSQPLRILDVAAGGGDVLIGLARQARRCGVSLEGRGYDISATAVAHAQAAAQRADLTNVEFDRHDALIHAIEEPFDVVICTLFLHHLADRDAVELLRRMSRIARRTVLVDDLLRTRRGYLLAWTGCRLLTRSEIVRFDGPLSVRSAYRLTEARELADRAGLAGATICRHWPERFLLSWRKP